jgi:hypothetical protein
MGYHHMAQSPMAHDVPALAEALRLSSRQGHQQPLRPALASLLVETEAGAPWWPKDKSNIKHHILDRLVPVTIQTRHHVEVVVEHFQYSTDFRIIE